jgi:hypothetical protein
MKCIKYDAMKMVIKSAFIILAIASCSEKKRVSVTPEYITSSDWSKQFSSSFYMQRMFPKKDSLLDIFHPDFFEGGNSMLLVPKLEPDSFAYQYKSESPSGPIGDTVYFQKKNKGMWYKSRGFNDPKPIRLEVVDNLERKGWYRFSQIVSFPHELYVYCDSAGMVHSFGHDLSNF